jgi:FkbM family methyltransferase
MSRLPLKHYVRNLKLIERNREWWAAGGVTTREKVSYYGSIARVYAKREKVIRYLGRDLHFDNPATPLVLQNYPYEITRKVLANMDLVPRTMLDVGANIGQFSLTMYRALDGAITIDAFEPNPSVYRLLAQNVQGIGDIKLYQYGIGDKDGEAQIHFEPMRSGIGSIIKENAGDPTATEVIQISGDPASLTGRKEYDLVKVDVEGYELPAITGLSGIRPRYLFLEVSGLGRAKDYSHSRLFAQISEQWGEFDICYTVHYRRADPTFDILLKFVG